MSFTRMDEGQIQEWMLIGQEVAKRQARMPHIIKSMLAQLEEQTRPPWQAPDTPG